VGATPCVAREGNQPAPASSADGCGRRTASPLQLDRLRPQGRRQRTVDGGSRRLVAEDDAVVVLAARVVEEVGNAVAVVVAEGEAAADRSAFDDRRPGGRLITHVQTAPLQLFGEKEWRVGELARAENQVPARRRNTAAVPRLSAVAGAGGRADGRTTEA